MDAGIGPPILEAHDTNSSRQMAVVVYVGDTFPLSQP